MSDRYRRQETAFPHEKRTQTFIADLGGQGAPLTSAFLKAGAAAAGIPRVWSDYHGSGGEGRHWLLGSHDALVATVNGDVEYDYLDPDFLDEDLRGAIAGCENAWVVVHANDPSGAVTALRQLADLPVRVLLALAAPGGAVVERHPSPASALERLGGLDGQPAVAAGSAELAVAAAGVALNEVILAGASIADELTEPRIVLFYSLHRRRRIGASPATPLEDLVGELAEPAEAATFRGRRIVQVGAGALGNWASIGMALDGGVEMDVVDGDPRVEEHNLNRQLLLVHGVGRPKAPVLTGELQALDPEGTYTACQRHVERPEDLELLDGADALVMAPDNDDVRLLGAGVAWRRGVPCASGGTGVAGGQVVLQQPGRACFGCITGLAEKQAPRADAAGASCAMAANEAIVASNMLVGGLLVSELRASLAGGRTQNLRFFGDSAGGNRLGRMTSDPDCPHRAEAGAPEGACALEA